MNTTEASASSNANITVSAGARSACGSSRASASTQNTNVDTSSPTRTWPNRSRQNPRSTRGENCPLASCNETTSSENTTPAVVMVAPAMMPSRVLAVPGAKVNVHGSGRDWCRLSIPASTTATAAEAKSIKAGRNSRLSRSLSRTARSRSRRRCAAASPLE